MRVVKLAHGYWGEQCPQLLSRQAVGWRWLAQAVPSQTSWGSGPCQPMDWSQTHNRAQAMLRQLTKSRRASRFIHLLPATWSPVPQMESGKQRLVRVQGKKNAEVHLYNQWPPRAFCEQSRHSPCPHGALSLAVGATTAPCKQGLLSDEDSGRKDHACGRMRRDMWEEEGLPAQGQEGGREDPQAAPSGEAWSRAAGPGTACPALSNLQGLQHVGWDHFSICPIPGWRFQWYEVPKHKGTVNQSVFIPQTPWLSQENLQIRPLQIQISICKARLIKGVAS